MKKMTRLCAAILTLVMALTLVVPTLAAVEDTGFDDVPANAWYAEAVEYCKENGLMNGTSTTRFEPNGTMTRAMLVTALYRQAGQPAVAGTDSFTDTAEGTWYSDAVLWASQQKVVNGYGNGLFGVNDPVTREQIVTILWRMVGSPATEDGEAFADQESISRYAVTAVSWAKANGIVNGKGGNRFDPKGNATRAEVATILTNQAKAAEQAPAPSPAPSPSTPPVGGDPGSSGGNPGGPITPAPAPTPAPADDDFALIQGGAFQMGSPAAEPERSSDEIQHNVTVSSFYMAKTEVSQKAYQEVMGVDPSDTKGDNLPVTNITWYDAIEYCNKLSEAAGLTSCYTIDRTTVTWDKTANGYRLPTEAEWEYAARANTTTPFSFGDYVHNSDANCYNAYGYNNDASGNWVNGSDAYLRHTVEVTRYPANAYGLYNMHGNVAEWVWDWYGEYDTSAAANPTGPENGNAKIIRGGGWNDHPKHIRSAYRGAQPADVGLYSIGIRPVRNAQATAGTATSTYSAVAQEKTGKTLIVYFSQTGNTAGLANLIHEMSGCDIFRLERKIPYSSSSNGPILYGEALDELRAEATPELKEFPDISQYDTILLGYCNWWSSIPASVRTLLTDGDFSGKTIVPFCSMGGGRFGQTISAIAKLAPDSVIKEGLEVTYSSYDRDEISAWLEKSIPDRRSEYTESLTFVKEGSAYTVTGVGDETTIVIPAEHEGLPVTKLQGDYGTGAFANKAFTSVTIPDTVVEIGQNTFYGCKQLTEVKLGTNSKLTTIGNNAFSACSSLKSVTIPKGVTTIGDSAFNNCSSLEGFTVAGNNTVFRSENGHLIETATQTLIRGVNHSTIPDSVTTLEVRSFQRANGITELNIPKSVTKIGNYFINESTITKINYAGTQAEWEQIDMKSMWNYGNRNVQVVCAEEPAVPSSPKILIAYFSATNNTENIANHIKTTLGDDAGLYEIVPEIPYTSADLNYNTDCRANREQNDPNARPAISGGVDNMDQYDVIFLGYPIWWGQAPKIISTFLESYDLSGKSIVPFCTSGSSGIGSSATNLHSLASGATWLDGQRFSGSASQSTVASWVNGLDLPKQEENKMYIQVSGAQNAVWTATLVENTSTAALKELLKSGPLTIQMSDYNSFEKWGPIGQSLPTNDERISTEAGDIILYQGSNIAIYYDHNNYNFTRLGKVDNVTQAQMKAVFGTGNVTVTMSLTAPNH